MKRKSLSSHDSYDDDDTRSAGEGAWLDRTGLRPTRCEYRSFVSTDHAPCFAVATQVQGCVRADRTARILIARSRQGFRNQQGECEETPAAGVARNAKQLTAQRPPFLKLPEGTLALGGGPGLN